MLTNDCHCKMFNEIKRMWHRFPYQKSTEILCIELFKNVFVEIQMLNEELKIAGYQKKT